VTDLDAAAYLKELSDYNNSGCMVTPACPEGRDTSFQCAFDHAIRALEERAGVKTSVCYTKNANGTYTARL